MTPVTVTFIGGAADLSRWALEGTPMEGGSYYVPRTPGHRALHERFSPEVPSLLVDRYELRCVHTRRLETTWVAVYQETEER